MLYTCRCDSPLGGITLLSDGEALTGLWFDGQRYFDGVRVAAAQARTLDVFDDAKRWLDIYFSGRAPGFVPKLSLQGTAFQRIVWELLLALPYGEVTTYGALAGQAAHRLGAPHSSARAVGGAVARNPVSIIVPCHRVIGAGGALTGYAGGLDRKRRLLALEGAALPGSADPG